MKGIVFDDIIKVMKGLKHFLNFLKLAFGPPFASGSDACGPPFAFGWKFLNHSKDVFFASKVNNFMKEMVFDYIVKVLKSFKQYLEISSMYNLSTAVHASLILVSYAWMNRVKWSTLMSMYL